MPKKEKNKKNFSLNNEPGNKKPLIYYLLISFGLLML